MEKILILPPGHTSFVTMGKVSDIAVSLVSRLGNDIYTYKIIHIYNICMYI